jgi:ribosomal protein S18 acetylase RimI-like enzyme
MSDPTAAAAGDPRRAAPAVEVRAAAPADIPAVLALWARARSANASTPDTPEAVRRLLETDPGALLVAETAETAGAAGADGAIVGVLIAAWDGWRGNMYRLAVDPAHRRRGIALALVGAGGRRLAEQGATRVTALVAHDETDAVGLWAAAGYARDETIARFVRNL